MAQNSQIEWTDNTWNPILGCSRVSEGCRHCYAETIAGRFGAQRGSDGQLTRKPTVYDGLTQIVNGRPVWTGKIAETRQLLQPLSWRQPRRVFVNSMSDLFHENVSDVLIDRIFAVMALCPQHTFQVLTKRPQRMLDYLSSGPMARVREAMVGFSASRIHLARTGDPTLEWAGLPLPNVWLGVSVENQAAADERIPLLLQTPAAVRFISAEPLLGEVDLSCVPYPAGWEGLDSVADGIDSLCYSRAHLDWVICGGESGHGARPMHPDWARLLRNQCAAAGVPFFFKQWGEWGPGSVHMSTGNAVFRQFESFQQWVNKADSWVNGGDCVDAKGAVLLNGGGMKKATYPVTVMHRVGKKIAGALLDGVEHKAFPEVPHVAG